MLDKYKQAAIKAYRSFEDKGIRPSLKEMRNAVIEFYEGRKIREDLPKNVVGYIDRYIDDSIQRGRKQGAIQAYDQLKNVLRSIQGGETMEFRDLTERFLNDMVNHMVIRFDYQTSQIHKIQKKLITVINDARRTGAYDIPDTLLGQNQSWRVKLPSQSTSGRGIALTPEELRRIEKAKLYPRLEKVRDRFLIGINTGQRYSDFKDLNQDDVVQFDGKQNWDILQKKTGKRVKIPVNKACQDILKKYDGKPPTISKQKFNKYIKEVCREAGITDLVKVRKVNPLEGEKESKLVPKCDLISSHDCRRTTATIMHNKGVPFGEIKRITGHSNLRELQKYIKVDESKPISALENLY
jgi:integrase